MTPDIDIHRAANVVIKQYGEKARLHATMRADALLKAGDLDGLATWKRILRAVEELQRANAGPGVRIH
jgi:hypothetical protein